MKKIIILSIFLLAKVVYSQSVLMTVNNDTIYTSVFEKNQKNSLEKLGVKQTVNNYLNFVLLKQYALKYNLDKTEGFQAQLHREAEKMKDSLYYPSHILEPVLQDYYQKVSKQRAVQIVFFKEEIVPKDTKKAEKFVADILGKINNKTLAFQDAVDQYSATTAFRNPVYFDVFSLQKFLVDAIYEAPINKPVQFVSKDGYYFLILVSDERKYLGEVALDEILIKDQSETGKEKAETIYNEIKQNGNYVDAKKKYSENQDEVANRKRVSLYTDIQDKQLYQYTAEAIQSNDPARTLFPPIKTAQGYTIYKYLFRESYDTYAQARKRLYSRLKKSPQIEKLDAGLAESLKGEKGLNYHENTENYNRFLNALPKTYTEFQNLKLYNNDVIFSVGDSVQLTTQKLYSQLKNIHEQDYPEIKEATGYLVNEMKTQSILDYYKSHFFDIDKFKGIWNNLEDQILIQSAFTLISFQAQQDTQGQKEFLEKEAAKYTWPERIQGTFYSCLNSDVEQQVIQMLKNKKSADYIKNYFTGKTDFNNNELLVMDKGKVTKESLNLPADKKLSVNEIYTADQKNRKLVIQVEKIFKNDKMTLEELQTSYINEYIDYKTTGILDQLKKDAKINLNESQEKTLEDKYGS